ncbi:MAG: hypothetical protein GXP55_17380 [Deltaproteobacteria bacterium]|nr:hypothetical protein [Deltaproteobacteria bacterium]
MLLRTKLRKTEPLAYVTAPRWLGSSPAERAEGLRQAVEEVLSACGRAPDSIIADLDGREASMRRLGIPAGAAKRAADIVPFELEPLLPLDAEDAVIDQQPIGIKGDQLMLLAVAAPRARVEERLAELMDAGVEPKHLLVGAACLEGLVPFLPLDAAEASVLLVEIRRDRTEVLILDAGRASLSRTLGHGLADVEAGRREALEADLKRSLAAHRSDGGEAPVHAYLIGEAALLPKATEWLAGLLDVETSVPDMPDLPGAVWPESIQFAHALALAGRAALKGKRVDLRRGEFASRKASGALRAHAPLLAACALSVVFSLGFSVWARYSTLSSEHERLGEELGDMTERYFDVRTESSSRARELLAGGRSGADPLPRFDAWDALDALSKAIPPDITHDTRRLDIELDDEAHDGEMRVQGTVESIAQRDTIAEALAEHECFQEIRRGPTSPGAGNEGLNYRLEVDIRCPWAPAPTKNRRGSRSRGHH